MLAGCIASLSWACGGKSDSDVFDNNNDDGGSGGTSAGGSGGTGTGGTAAGGSSSGSSNSNGTADSGGAGGTQSSNDSGSGTDGSTAVTATVTTSGSSGGASSTGSGTTGSGGGGPDERCQLPIQSGDCDAAFTAYGYDVETGRCEQFIYGGCGGNENRFDSLDDCLAVCDPNGRTACENSQECVIDHGCCGFCGMDNADELVAVNQKYASYTDPQCFAVDCAYCPPSDEIAQYGARCNEGSCEVYDVRESDISACNSDADCQLRGGLGCCESCGETEWVAVNTNEELIMKELCGDLLPPCPACLPAEPEGITAICGAQGHCAIAILEER